MNWIMNYLERLKEGIREREDIRVRERANAFFQVTEHQGKLWFTYNGNLFCPCDMMKKEPIESLSELRAYYTTRNTSTAANKE